MVDADSTAAAKVAPTNIMNVNKTTNHVRIEHGGDDQRNRGQLHSRADRRGD